MKLTFTLITLLIGLSVNAATSLDCKYSIDKMVPDNNFPVPGTFQLVKVVDNVSLTLTGQNSQFQSAAYHGEFASLGLKFSATFMDVYASATATVPGTMVDLEISDSTKEVSLNTSKNFDKSIAQGTALVLSYHKKIDEIEHNVFLNCTLNQ